MESTRYTNAGAIRVCYYTSQRIRLVGIMTQTQHLHSSGNVILTEVSICNRRRSNSQTHVAWSGWVVVTGRDLTTMSTFPFHVAVLCSSGTLPMISSSPPRPMRILCSR